MTTDQHTTPTDPSPRPDEPGRGPLWSQLRPLVLRLHFYAGVLVGPFVLVAAVTGLIYTATPQLEQIVYRDQLTATTGQVALPLGEQVQAARAAHPDGQITEIDPPEADGRSTRVVFTDDSVPADYAMSVFVDPATGEVLGQVQSFGQWLGVRAWVDELHRNLHLGAVGRNYSELAASWIWVVVLGGLALWFTKRRRDGRARRLLLPDPTTRGRGRHLSWHGALGTWIAVGLLGLSITGLTWSHHAGANIGALRTALSWQSEPLTTTLDAEAAEQAAGEHHHGGHDEAAAVDDAAVTGAVDDVLVTARNQGLGDPLVLTPPSAAREAWTAAENKRSWPTAYDTIAVDPDGGAVTDRVDFADWPFMAKVTDWVIGLHMGILLGPLNQVALAALAVALVVVIVRGYLMWWRRRPTRATGLRFGPAARRGTWRRVAPLPLAVVVLVTVVVGYLVPLLGVSLVAFLAVDAVIGRVGSRRRVPDDAQELETEAARPLGAPAD